MKKVLFLLVFTCVALIGNQAFAQTQLNGKPASYGGGVIRCGMTDGLCATLGEQDSFAGSDGQKQMLVTVFTQDGPISFKASSDYQILGDSKGGATLIVDRTEQADGDFSNEQ
jgi:hypothetical protein